jgi:hypothetical protein
MPKTIKGGTPAWYRAQIVKAARGLLQNGGTVEDALDCCVMAARHEWAVTITVVDPAKLRIDGHAYTWPEPIKRPQGPTTEHPAEIRST